MLLFYPALAAGLLGGRKWRAPGRWILIGMIVAAVLAGVVLPIMPATASGGCLITCMDVGQGDATLIQAGGSAVLIDGGPDPDVLSRKLRSRRLCYLDAVVISHAESDHIGGLSAALDQCKVGMLIHPGTKTGGTMEKLLGQAEQLGVGTRIMRKGDSLSVGEIGLKALGPPQEIPEGAAANEYCLVIRADVNGVSLLLTGDIEEEGEDYLLREPGALTCDIIKVPHHGGFAEGCGEFFYAVKPRVALIGVGKDNRYGHPTRATLQALQRCGCAIYRTDLDGDIRVEALPGGLRVECERSRAA
jgi:competence protein ComEC